MEEIRRGSLLHTRAAVLQGLRRGPSSGVELVRWAAEATAGRLRLSRAGVYAALETFRKQGLIRSRLVTPGGRRGARRRTLYELTPAGVAASDRDLTALRRLLGARPSVETPPSEQRVFAERFRRIGEIGAFLRRGREALEGG